MFYLNNTPQRAGHAIICTKSHCLRFEKIRFNKLIIKTIYFCFADLMRNTETNDVMCSVV